MSKITINRTTLKIMRWSLLWPSIDKEMNPTKSYYFTIIAFVAITSFFSDQNLDISEDLACTVSISGLYLMIYSYVKNQRLLAEILADLSDCGPMGSHESLRLLDDRLNTLSKYVLVYSTSTVSFYGFVKFLYKNRCEEINESHGNDDVCGVVLPAWLPYDLLKNPRVYYPFFAYQLLVACTLLKIALIISYQMYEIVEYLIYRIGGFKRAILECFEISDDLIRKKIFSRAVKEHVIIMDLADKINSCFKNCMFCHLTITGVICGCLENQMIKTEYKVLPGLHITGWIFALFVACLGGQRLIDATSSIPQDIYFSKWYEADVGLQKDFAFLLMRSQKIQIISAGSFGIVSFPLFVSVIKMSYSILTLLSSQNL